MSITKGRRFTLLDAMVLVVAVAVGLTLARHPLDQLLHQPSPTVTTITASSTTPSHVAYIRDALRAATRGSTTVYPSVLAFTFAALALRLRHPRPRLRRIFRQPGAVGYSAAIFSFFLAFLTLSPGVFRSLFSSNFNRWSVNFWLNTSRLTSVAVASAWVTLTLSGHWQSERTWVNRLGQLVAGSWIVAIFLQAAALWASFL